MTHDQNIQALQNAVTHYALNVIVMVKGRKFYLLKGDSRISPTLTYNELNHFIMGAGQAKKLKL
jgi:hypothetical protein